jgi:hypothetical protein
MRMDFRLVGPHQHQATAGGQTFFCFRRVVRIQEGGLAISWSASRGEVVLKNDCRTLNEAKNLCRAAARPTAKG